MTGRVLMVQGTSSSVGKSLIVMALCRMFARRGVRVAPFKAQNMSNNAAVCADGGEIGRSQALQAYAAGIAPAVAMNPILMKPEANGRSQLIVNGRRWKTLGTRDYFGNRQTLWPVVTDALNRLRDEYELVVMEGAGSPAEMNLRDVEIVNMAVAKYCRAPVLLVGDIERGGVFAQLLGTLWLLDDDERSLVSGLIVNKFHGDVSLFDQGRQILEQRGGVAVMGVIPWVPNLNLPEEDAEALNRPASSWARGEYLDIAVIRLPQISNFDDFAPLAGEPGVRLRYVDSVLQLGQPHAVILPGSKSTMSDLAWLRQTGLSSKLIGLFRHEMSIVGICGGYQMLGQSLHDPDRIESEIAEMPGLGLLPSVTVFSPQKETSQVRGTVVDDRHCPGSRGQAVDGYEIHMGHTTGGKPWLELTRSRDPNSKVKDGATSEDGRAWGCYVHGLFGNDAFRHDWLRSLAQHRGSQFAAHQHQSGANQVKYRFADDLEESLNRFTNQFEESIDVSLLERIVWNPKGAPS